jgi:hypothetical protein
MTDVSKEQQVMVERVENGWLLRFRGILFVAKTPREVAKVIEQWAKKQADEH